MIVNQQVKVPFSIGTYKDGFNCDIVPMEAWGRCIRMRFRKDIKRNKHKLKDLIRATEEEKVEEF